MFGYLVLLFTIVPAVELMLLIKVGTYIGAANTLFVIIFTGVLGAYLARLQGFFLFQKINDNLNRGIMPSEEMLDGLMVLVGGIFLLTPGFITDAIGFMLLIPAARSIIKLFVKKKFQEGLNSGNISHVHIHKRDNEDKSDFEDAQFFE